MSSNETKPPLNIPPKSEPTIGELVAKVTAQFSALIHDEIHMSKLQVKAKLAKLGTGGALLAVAAVVALYMLGMLLMAAAFGIGAALGGRWWAGFLIVGGALLLVTAVIVAIGVAKLQTAQQDRVNPAAGIAKSVDAFKKGLQNE